MTNLKRTEKLEEESIDIHHHPMHLSGSPSCRAEVCVNLGMGGPMLVVFFEYYFLRYLLFLSIILLWFPGLSVACVLGDSFGATFRGYFIRCRLTRAVGSPSTTAAERIPPEAEQVNRVECMV